MQVSDHAGPPCQAYAVRRGPDPEDPRFERVTLVSPDGGRRPRSCPAPGMVGVSMTLDGVELLARRHGLAGYLERASTFGIPLLAPWANRLARAAPDRSATSPGRCAPGDPAVHVDEYGQPIHGLSAGAPEWEVEDVGATDDSAWLRARLRVDAAARRGSPASPSSTTCVVEVALEGRTLRVATSLTATGDRPCRSRSGGTRGSSSPTCRAPSGSSTSRSRAARCSAPTKIPTGEVVVDPVPAGPLGRPSSTTSTSTCADGTVASVRAGSRGVDVTYVSGYDVGVVFAPAELDIVCLEPMTAPTDPFSGRFPLRARAAGGDGRGGLRGHRPPVPR